MRMARWLACLVPWMAMTAAWAGSQAVKVQYAFQGANFQALKVEDKCYVTPAVAKSWGWNVALRDKELEIAGEGRLFRVPAVEINNDRYFDLGQAATFVGAKTAWDGDLYRVLGSIRGISVTKDGLEVDSTIKTQPKLFRLDSPDRLVVDFYGADLEERLVKDLPAWWRVAQFGKDVVRVVIEHPGVAAVKIDKESPTRRFDLSLPDICQKDPASVTAADVLKAAQAAGVDPSDPKNAPLILDKPVVVKEGDSDVVLQIPTSAKLSATPSLKYLGPNRLQISVPKAQFAEMSTGKIDGTKWVDSVATSGDNAAAVLVLETPQPMAFNLTTNGNAIVLRLFRPANTGGKLVGKIIVVDAGHGGRDSGTTYGKVSEKNLTLPVANELVKQLSAAGASVIATRTQDTYPTLDDRCRIANDSGADLFISVHINSNQQDNSRSGTITFFHMQDPVARLLGECIQAEIGLVNNMPDIGVWSDSRIYKNDGFKVLRDTKMPAVLIELGFLNHSTDRAEMTKKDFPDRIAAAIVKGVRTYLGDKEKN